MRALIFPCLTRITSCFVASVAQSGFAPLNLQTSNTTTRFNNRLSNFCNFTPRIHQKQSQKLRNPKIFLGGIPPSPPSRRSTAYWNPLFKILDLPLQYHVCIEMEYIIYIYICIFFSFYGRVHMALQMFITSL